MLFHRPLTAPSSPGAPMGLLLLELVLELLLLMKLLLLLLLLLTELLLLLLLLLLFLRVHSASALVELHCSILVPPQQLSSMPLSSTRRRRWRHARAV
jgi:hypothetical protein